MIASTFSVVGSPPNRRRRGERRGGGVERRQSERRAGVERRYDPRIEDKRPAASLLRWAKLIFHARLGVDRRAQGERRQDQDRRIWAGRRAADYKHLLTPEELAVLLENED